MTHPLHSDFTLLTCARTAFVLCWADAEERIGRTYPGTSLESVAPSYTPGRFYAWARAVVEGAEKAADQAAVESWAHADSETLGSALALTCGGWADGLGAEGLAHPVGLPNMDSHMFLHVDAQEFRDSLPEVNELKELTAWNLYPRGAALYLEDAIANESRPDPVLELANELIDGFGIESIDLPAPSDEENEGRVTYVNMGDTYATTLCWIEDPYCPDGRFEVTSWGTVLETAEKERTLATGEIRCPYCGDWGCEEHPEY